MSGYVLRSKLKTNDTSLSKLPRDLLIDGDNDGVKHLFDLGFGWCYPAGELPRPAPTNPDDGDQIRDMSNSFNDGVVLKPSGIVKTYAGGGITTDAAVQNGSPQATVSADGVLQGFTQSTKYLLVTYCKLAALSSWQPTGSSVGTMITACNFNETYVNGPELCLISALPIVSGVGGISARFQSSIGNVSRIDMPLPTGVGLYSDDIVQISVWFDGSAARLRVKSASFDSTLATPFTGNTESVVGNALKFDTNASNFGGTTVPHRYYRGFIENITQSGRNPISVMDDDYARTIARGVFS